MTRGEVGQIEVPPNLIPPGCESITPEMLPLVALQAEHVERIVQSVPGGATNIQDIYPLAPLQEGILFHNMLDQQGGDPYLLSTVLSVTSRERLDELIDALQSVIDRHDVLRTAVLWEQLPQPVQVVHRQASLPVQYVVLDSREQAQQWMQSERQKLDLRQAPLMRLQVAADPDGQWYVLLEQHHLTIDHISVEILMSEVAAHLQGRAHTHLEPIPYRNHIAQALAYARTHDTDSFFRSKLGMIEEPTVPFGLLGVHGDGSRIDNAREALDRDLAQRVRAQVRRLGVSAATLFHAAWALVLSHTSAREDVVFGTVLLGRLQGSAGAQRILGMFINTLPLRLQLQGFTARELVEQTQRELVELLVHEQASLAVAQRCSGIVGSAPLFTSLLNYRHSAPNADADFDKVSGVRVLAGKERTNYPVTLLVDDLGEGFVLTAQTDQRIDSRRIVGYLSTAMRSLIEALERQLSVRALDLSIVPESEQHLLLEELNATQTPYPHDKLIQELFEKQVEQTPDAVAVVYEEQSLTYAELNARSNQLARYLTGRGVSSGDYVPIVMPRCVQMIVSQLAVLKCGGVYVPVDPEYPVERQAFMLRDCGALHVLAAQEQPTGLESVRVDWIDCTAVAEAIEELPVRHPQVQIRKGTPAYVMYTSGSTGEPKGVIVEHGSVNRLVINNGYAAFEAGDCVAQCSNPAFDASTFEIWGALLNGARLVIVPQSVVLDVESFASLLKQQHVTVLWLTAGLFAQYAQALSGVFPQLRYLLTGGDVVDPDWVRQVLRTGAPVKLINGYGPTECTTFSATYAIEAIGEDVTSLPIGRPISNTRIYILDAQRRPVPLGATGELYIGGAGVARGYLNRPELTAERFIADPFGQHGGRLYKTGDLGRWRADGVIEYLGRNDHQVKIRGFRIELGEIEAQLRRHPQVKEAAVLAREDTEGSGEKRLVAYVISGQGSDARASAKILQEHLKERLPDYMVPSTYVWLESLPLMSNGKLNRRALPVPDQTGCVGDAYEAPQGEVEEILAGIWQELLHVERVGRWDNFFELGGNSITSLKVVQQALAAGLRLTTGAIFEHQTIARLAPTLATSHDRVQKAQDAVDGEQILLPIQRRFLLSDSRQKHHFNQSTLLRVPAGFEASFLQEFATALYARHDVLRLSFSETERGWAAVYRDYSELLARKSVAIVRESCDSGVAQSECIQKLGDLYQSSLDISHGPLLLLVHFCFGSEGIEDRLLIIVHHLVVDVVSFAVLLDDLEDAWHQWRSKGPIRLREKTSSYQEWARHLLEYSHSSLLQAELPYWKGVLKKEVLYQSARRISSKSGFQDSTDSVNVSLSRVETNSILTSCNKAHETQTVELLLTALLLACCRTFGTNSLRLDLEGHGREELFGELDLSQTVGWFTSIYPFYCRLDSSDPSSVTSAISSVRANYRGVPNHGVGYGILYGLARNKKLIACEKAAGVSPMVFNFIGETGGVVASEFTPTSDSHGRESVGLNHRSPEQIGIVAAVVQGSLAFSLDYDRSYHDRADILSFAGNVKTALQEIILCSTRSADSERPLQRSLEIRSTSSIRLPSGLEPSVVFNHHQPGPMLMLIPPGAGGPESYFKLQQCLNPFGFSTCLLENPEVYRDEFAPFDEICDYYLAVIRKNQPSSPYHLAGWSRGAQIAHRIAIRLADQGECVASLILIDPVAFDVSAAKLTTVEADPRLAELPSTDRKCAEALLSVMRAYDQVKPVRSHCVLIKAGQGIEMGTAVASRSSRAFQILDDHLDWERIVIDSVSEPGYERYLEKCRIVRMECSHDELLDGVNCLTIAREIAAAMAASLLKCGL